MLKKFTVYFIFGLLLAVTLASCAKPKTPEEVCWDSPIRNFTLCLFFGVEEWLSTLGSHRNHLKCLLKLKITGLTQAYTHCHRNDSKELEPWHLEFCKNIQTRLPLFRWVHFSLFFLLKYSWKLWPLSVKQTLRFRKVEKRQPGWGRKEGNSCEFPEVSFHLVYPRLRVKRSLPPRYDTGNRHRTQQSLLSLKPTEEGRGGIARQKTSSWKTEKLPPPLASRLWMAT